MYIMNYPLKTFKQNPENKSQYSQRYNWPQHYTTFVQLLLLCTPVISGDRHQIAQRQLGKLSKICWASTYVSDDGPTRYFCVWFLEQEANQNNKQVGVICKNELR